MKKENIAIKMSRLARIKEFLSDIDINDVYEERLDAAKELVNEIKSKPNFDIRLFRASSLEREFGIFDGEGELEIDESHIMQNIILGNMNERDDIENVIFNELDEFVNEELTDDVRKAALELYYVYKDYWEVTGKRYSYIPGEKLPDDIWNLITKTDKRLTESWDNFVNELDCTLSDEYVIRRW